MVYLDESQHTELHHIAKRRHTSVAALIRSAVDGFLHEQRAERPRLSFIGIGRGPAPDNVSERAHEVYGEILNEEYEEKRRRRGERNIEEER